MSRGSVHRRVRREEARVACDVEMKLRVRWIGRRWTMARGFVGEELSGEKQRWRCSRLSEETERREWGGCAARKGGGECSARVLALSGEGRRGVVVRMVEVAQTGTGR